MEFDFRELPVLKDWMLQTEPPMDADAYITHCVSLTDALVLAEFMMPSFVLVKGCVLRSAIYDPVNFEDWWSAVSGDTVQIEHVLNRLCVWDYFDFSCDVEERALWRLAELIAECWLSRAQQQFPDREFVSEVVDIYGPTVIITQREEPVSQP